MRMQAFISSKNTKYFLEYIVTIQYVIGDECVKNTMLGGTLVSFIFITHP